MDNAGAVERIIAHIQHVAPYTVAGRTIHLIRVNENNWISLYSIKGN